MQYVKSLIKIMLAFILACISTFLLASIFSTQFVIAYHGVDVSLADRFSMTFADLYGMLTKGKAFTPYSNIIGYCFFSCECSTAYNQTIGQMGISDSRRGGDGAHFGSHV